VSLVGDALRGITLILWQYSASGGSARAVSVGVLSEHLPALLAAPAMGVLADRYDRKKIIVISCAVRAAGCCPNSCPVNSSYAPSAS